MKAREAIERIKDELNGEWDSSIGERIARVLYDFDGWVPTDPSDGGADE